MPDNIRVFMVGGIIRDNLLGLESHDIDFSVEAPSYEDMREFIIEHGRIYKEDPQFFTIRAHLDDLNGWKGDADFVLCRKEGAYRDGRHPDRVEVGTIYDDLARRDFTMDAIALPVYPIAAAPDDYYDPFNGVKDIQKGIIRCVGDPYQRFYEDALRMARAVRFSVTKSMQLHPSIKKILKDYEFLGYLQDKISIERKREELTKMFAYDTMASIAILYEYPAFTLSMMGDDRLWLKPTTEKR
jgi:tRNA nucleotidyltransferase/poly(A) polymerase